jgi:hypothetical protein
MMTATATEIGTTEIVTGIATGIAMEAGETIDVSPLERDTVVVPEIMMTIRDVLPIMKMTVAGTSVVTAMKTVAASEEDEAEAGEEALLVKTHEMGIVADVVNKTKMAWVAPKGDRPHPKELCRYRRGEGRLLGGM